MIIPPSTNGVRSGIEDGRKQTPARRDGFARNRLLPETHQRDQSMDRVQVRGLP